MSRKSDVKSKLSRRKFLLGSVATAASAAVTVNSERADAFFNTFGFMKKSAGDGQTSNGYAIGQSLRFSSAASCNLSRAPVGAGNQKTWTLSSWVKRGKLGSQQPIFSSNPSAGNVTDVAFDAGDLLYFRDYQGNSMLGYTQSPGVYRDPSSWYHIVAVMDRSNATASNRMRLYVNGTRVDTVSTSPDGGSGLINSTSAHNLGVFAANPIYFDGYLSEVCFIDGQALDASYFGQIDANSGQWIPKAYSGSYGPNGFYLKFADNSNTTAATLGKDSSPNGNNWTPSGLATHDQVLDSPTNNFCTLSPLVRINTASCTLSAGGLTASISASGADTAYGGVFAPSGKWYWEVTAVSSSGTNTLFTGIRAGSEKYPFGAPSYSQYGGDYAYYLNGGTIDYNDGPWIQTGLSTAGNGANIGVALDVSGSTVTFFLNGTKVGSTQSIQARSDWTAYAQSMSSTSNVATWNFGQGGQAGLTYDAASGGRFKYTPPAGFKALCTANLPSNMPVVTSGAFTGNASADGPFVWLGGAPTDVMINGNAVTWGTHADKLANGFKIRTSSASYNASGSNSFSATVPAKFKWATARANP